MRWKRSCLETILCSQIWRSINSKTRKRPEKDNQNNMKMNKMKDIRLFSSGKKGLCKGPPLRDKSSRKVPLRTSWHKMESVVHFHTFTIFIIFHDYLRERNSWKVPDFQCLIVAEKKRLYVFFDFRVAATNDVHSRRRPKALNGTVGKCYFFGDFQDILKFNPLKYILML